MRVFTVVDCLAKLEHQSERPGLSVIDRRPRDDTLSGMSLGYRPLVKAGRSPIFGLLPITFGPPRLISSLIVMVHTISQRLAIAW